MAQVGELQRGREIGKTPSSLYIWAVCQDCGVGRWTRYNTTEHPASFPPVCHICSGRRVQKLSPPTHGKGSNSPHWKGGRNKTRQGYIRIWIGKDDFFSSMATKNGFVLEHRLIRAKYLGRCLHRWEIVHHKNHIKSDNRIENLQLVTDDRHRQITLLEERIKWLEQRVTLLEVENTVLREGDYNGMDREPNYFPNK